MIFCKKSYILLYNFRLKFISFRNNNNYVVTTKSFYLFLTFVTKLFDKSFLQFGLISWKVIKSLGLIEKWWMKLWFGERGRRNFPNFGRFFVAHPLAVTPLAIPQPLARSNCLVYGGLLSNVAQQGHIKTGFLELQKILWLQLHNA